MNTFHLFLTRCLQSLVPAGLLLPGLTYAVTLTSTLNLEPGWNSVWLSVNPVYQSGDDVGEAMSVEDVFAEDDITIVARNVESGQAIEYVSDLSEQSLTREYWQIWWRDSVLEASNLSVIQGGAAYLVYHAGDSALSVDVVGEVVVGEPNWTADSYNFIGYSLDAGVTFESAFGGVEATHPIQKMFRLESDGAWVGVSGADTMESGEAYWIYCEGPSKFNGPLAFNTDFYYGVDFGDGVATIEVDDPDGGVNPISVLRERITLSNISETSVDVAVEVVEGDTSDLRIFQLLADPDSLSYALSNELVDDTITSLPAGETESVLIAAYRDWTYGARARESIYRVKAGGFHYWFTALAENPDLIDGESGSADPSYQGLWVGEVVLDAVTDLTSSGRPVEPTTGNAGMRVILHVDASDSVSLLSSVMLMEQVETEEGATVEPVLVVDETKIPYFAGIEQRGEHSVGIRIETVAYDMPRKFDVSTQANLLQLVVDASATDDLDVVDDVTAADILVYVNNEASRPIDLVDAYETSWPLEGALGPSQIVATSDGGELELDAYHRSNPFRHAFHKKHAGGYGVTRAMTLTFDDTQQPGVLSGSYQETLSGLAAADITLTGTIRLQRVSEVAELQ